MNEHVQVAESIFLAALEKPTPERAAYVEAACAGNVVLQQRVRELLLCHDQSRGPLDSPPPGLAGTIEMPTVREQPGTIIGPYKLLQQIGEGGMGVVYLAEQTQPVQRKVALKVIKPGMDSRQVIARFEAERQALAVMDHVNIARVIDGGTTESGRPYFVMELIDGVPITKYCDDNNMTPRERLELFVPVCQAIQHAHQKGIIHRDIKPSNVLVTLYDGKPVPKVIDFGVAKAIDQKLTDNTLCTNLGTMVGTLEYMSPEQADLNALGIDTRSDIYSLGVLLYELLTGSTPLTRKQFKEAANYEILRLIKEEEPQKPSTRLSESGDALASISAQRKMEPAKLSKLVRGELDWIVMKTLEKDRNRRYETANGLGRDIQRYLADESVEACPPSVGYRMRKFVRRNKGAVVAASLVLLVLLAGFIGTTYGLIQADRQREKAEKAEDETLAEFRTNTDDAIERLIGSKTELGEQEKAYLNNARKRWESLANRTGDDARSRAIRAEGRHRIAMIWAKLGNYNESRKGCEEALELRKKLVVDFPTAPDYRHLLYKTNADLAGIYSSLDMPNEALVHRLTARDVARQMVDDFPANPKFQQSLVSSHLNLGILLRKEKNNPESGMKELQAAVERGIKLVTEFPSDRESKKLLADIHRSMGVLLRDLAKPVDAGNEFVASRDLLKSLVAEYPDDQGYLKALALCQQNLGIFYRDQRKYKEARPEFESACKVYKKLATDYPSILEHRRLLAEIQYSFGLLLHDLGERNQAHIEYETARDLLLKLVIEYPNTLAYRRSLVHSYSNMARASKELGNMDEARREMESARDLLLKLVVEFPPAVDIRADLVVIHGNLGNILTLLKNKQEARAEYLAAIKLGKKLVEEFPESHKFLNSLAISHTSLGQLLAGEGNFVDARKEYETAVTIQKNLSMQFPKITNYQKSVAITYNSLALMMRNQEKFEEAENYYREAIASLEKMLNQSPAVHQVFLAGILCNFGNMLREQHKYSECLEQLNKALAILSPIYAKDSQHNTAREYLRNTYCARAFTLERQKKFEEAFVDWNKAVELSSEVSKSRVLVDRACTRMRAGQVDQGIGEINALIKADITDIELWFNFSRAFAVASDSQPAKRSEYAARSVELLRKAVTLGYKNAPQLKKEKDFDSLRDIDDFKKLYTEVEKQSLLKVN